MSDTITLPRELAEKIFDAFSSEVYPPAGSTEWYDIMDALRTALAAPEPESKTPAWWVDGLAVTLMREGVNKHRAREIAKGYWEAYCQIPEIEEDKT